MLTLFYIGATFLQSRRISSVCNKIGELAQQASVSFYALRSAETEDGYDALLATSDLCTNRTSAKVTEILWLSGNQRGCCVQPRQLLHLSPWISFPEAPNLLPFSYAATPLELVKRLTEQQELLHLLLETEIQSTESPTADIVKIEHYGKLVAWKIDSHLAVLITTDVENFTKFLIATFLQKNLFINDNLLLIRIESLTYEGKPQPYEMVSSHLRKATRTAEQLNDEDWKRHLEDLRALCVLANQATEFEQKKKSIEAKMDVVKPDLIPTAAVHIPSDTPLLPAKTPTKSPSKNMKSPVKKTTSNTSVTKTEVLSYKSHQEKLATDGSIKSDVAQEQTVKAFQMPLEKSIPKLPSPTKLSPVKVAATTQEKTELEKIAASLSEKQRSPLHLPSSVSSPLKAVEDSKAAVLPTESNGTNLNASLTSNCSNNLKRPSLKRHKDSLSDSKPFNILVYADSSSARESALVTLKDILEEDRYTLYALTPQQVQQRHWLENTALLVVCGAVSSNVGEMLVDYFLRGGRVLSLCSDILHFVLPTYRTAEVRENELVQFSYDRWQKVKMMHHIFCYQPSPVRKHFSTDSDTDTTTHARKPALVCPRSIQLKDLNGELHNLDVKVLGIEETWNTPSLLLANSLQSGGRAVFSQVHLETNPNQFETDETKFRTLKQNEQMRLEILADLLSKHLSVHIKKASISSSEATSKFTFPNAYFLGRHELKFELLQKLKEKRSNSDDTIPKTLTMMFCDKDEKLITTATNSAKVLPILIHSCPDDFSTVDYFNILDTSYIGRLLIYAPVVSSSMHVIGELEHAHGIAVLARQQTEGEGRSQNQWLSPLGCVMFSIQLQISLNSKLGSRLPLIQHIVGAAMVNALKGHDTYKHMDIALKWPNDIYANGVNKIGGLIVKTTLVGSNATVNIGCGINLNNSKPTTCVNDIISEFNRANNKNLPVLKYEQFIALLFNEIERLVEQVQTEPEGFENFYKLYYQLWLHSDQTITICNKEGKEINALVVGIDDFGYLLVKNSTGVVECVQPDGNSFDMLKGLIVPKFN